MAPSSPPAVTVIVATYNRADVLRTALEALRDQTWTDWEAWIIGDACTDHTPAVVDEFEDERMQFLNLPSNFGEQSGPNNEGLRRARGRFIAFLNHDDLLFPDHIERLMNGLKDEAADMVFSLVGIVEQDQRIVMSPSWTGDYESVGVIAPASSWLLRRELLERVGPWRAAGQTAITPSQDWILRAKAAGARIRQVPWLTCLAIQSGSRPGSYVTGGDAEHRALRTRMVEETGFRERLVTDAATRAFAELGRPRRPSGRRMLRDALWLVARSRTPRLVTFVRYRGRGRLIEELRRTRGLSPRP